MARTRSPNWAKEMDEEFHRERSMPEPHQSESPKSTQQHTWGTWLFTVVVFCFLMISILLCLTSGVVGAWKLLLWVLAL